MIATYNICQSAAIANVVVVVYLYMYVCIQLRLVVRKSSYYYIVVPAVIDRDGKSSGARGTSWRYCARGREILRCRCRRPTRRPDGYSVARSRANQRHNTGDYHYHC